MKVSFTNYENIFIIFSKHYIALLTTIQLIIQNKGQRMARQVSVLGTVSILSPSFALLYINSAGAPCLWSIK